MSLFAVFDDAVVTLINDGSTNSLLFVQKQPVVSSLCRPLPYDALFPHNGPIIVPAQLGIIQSIYSVDASPKDTHYRERRVGLLLLSITGELYYHGKSCPLIIAIDHVAGGFFKVEIPGDRKIISVAIDENEQAFLTQDGNVFVNYPLNERLKGGAGNADIFEKHLATRGTHPYYLLPRIVDAQLVSISFSRERLLILTSEAVNNVLMLNISYGDQARSTPKSRSPELNINFSDHNKYIAQQNFSNGTQISIEVSWTRLKFSHGTKKPIKIAAIYTAPYQVWLQSRAGEVFDLETRRLINQVSAQRIASNGSIHYVLGKDNIVRVLNLTKQFSSWASLVEGTFSSTKELNCYKFHADEQYPDDDESRELSPECDFAKVIPASRVATSEAVIYESHFVDTPIRITNRILDFTLNAQGQLLALELDAAHTAHITTYNAQSPVLRFPGYKTFQSSVNDLEINLRTMVCWSDGATALLQDERTICYFASGVRAPGAAAQAYVELQLPANARQNEITKLFAHHEPNGSRWGRAIHRKLLLVLTANNQLFLGSEHLVEEKREQHHEWIWEGVKFPTPIQISDVGIYEQALIILAEGKNIYLNGSALQLYFQLPADDVRKNIFPRVIPPECCQVIQGAITAKIVLGPNSFYILRSDGSVLGWRRTIGGVVPDQASKCWFIVTFPVEHNVTIKDIQRNTEHVYFHAENNILYTLNVKTNMAEVVHGLPAASHISYHLLVCNKLPPLYVDDQLNFHSVWQVYLRTAAAEIKKKMGVADFKIIEVAIATNMITLRVITLTEQSYLLSWTIESEPSPHRSSEWMVTLHLLGMRQLVN